MPEVSVELSLIVIVSVLVVTTVLSMTVGKKKQAENEKSSTVG